MIFQGRRQSLISLTIYTAALLFQQHGTAAWNVDVTTIARVPAILSRRVFSLKSIDGASENPSVRNAKQQQQVVQSGTYSAMSLDDAILNRHSCKKFRRYTLHDDATMNTNSTDVLETQASDSDPTVIQRAIESLNLARRTPTAFNTQPYKVVLVTSPEQKLAVSQYCLGPNRQKVLDSDCTAIFLADKQITRTFSSFRQLMTNIGIMKQRKTTLSNKALLTTQFYITVFSSGYPFPRLISSSISFIIRTCMALVNFCINMTKLFKYPLPTLSNAETWSSKQVMMVAMTYILACTSRGLATIPMEGINASGIRKVIKAPSRYAIPLIVSTGIPHDDKQRILSNDSKNVHDASTLVDDRYGIDELMFGDTFGSVLPITSS